MQEGDPVLRRRQARARRFFPRRSVVALGALLAAVFPTLSACATIPPVAIASTGDSIALGFDACGLLTACQSISYATGTAASSTSIYRRLLGSSPQLAGHAYDDAEVGARAVDLYSEMSVAVWQRADVVTVLIGANDACASTVGAMTPVATFQSQVDQAFGLFFSNRPGARIVLSSIPDLFRVWQVAHTNPHAQAIWQAAQLCPSMLDRPASTSQADMLRRVFVQLQIGKYNAALAQVCSHYRGCRWDGGSLGRYQFSLSELSPYDYFHPNAVGHRALANMAWAAYRS